MKKHWTHLLGVMLLAAMLLGTSACTAAELQALQGTLQNVDSASGTVTVKLSDNTTRTFEFKDVKLDTIRQSLGDASLAIGDQVTVKSNKNGHIQEVHTKNAEVDGIIKNVASDNVTITTAKKGDVTLTLTSETQIRIDDLVKATFSDLKKGQKVEAKYDVITNKALKISVDSGIAESKLEGTITAISDNATDKSVVITNAKRGDITLKITSATLIRIEDKGTAGFSELQKGQRVEATYDADSLTALKLKVNIDENEIDDDDDNNQIDEDNETHGANVDNQTQEANNQNQEHKDNNGKRGERD
jgi:cold shock CspA family protein